MLCTSYGLCASVCVCPSVTSRHCVETDERIELLFDDNKNILISLRHFMRKNELFAFYFTVSLFTISPFPTLFLPFPFFPIATQYDKCAY